MPTTGDAALGRAGYWPSDRVELYTTPAAYRETFEEAASSAAGISLLVPVAALYLVPY